MSTELTVYDRVTDPVVYAEKMGRAFALSGMFGLPNEEAGMVVAMTCLCEQITPIQFLRRYHIIQQRPTMRADAMLAEFRMNGGNHSVMQTSPDVAEIGLEDKDGKVLTVKITWDEAQQEDWPWRDKERSALKSNWATPVGRQDMLWARAVSRAIRKLAPEIVAGVYTPEEISDIVVADRQAPKQRLEPDPPTVNVLDVPFEAKERPRDASLLEIESLMLELVPDDKARTEQLQKVLDKRGVKSIDDLSKSQADELLDKLRSKIREQKN